MITRFAPSPTGYLHLGHLVSAYQVWQAAERTGGQVLLRIEDIDKTRCKPEYEAAIYEDLTWLGFAWPAPVRRQSEHFSDYAQGLETLRQRGLIYRCFRTRKDVMAQIGRAPHEPQKAFIGKPLPEEGEAAHVTAGDAFAWRLSLQCAREELGAAYETLGYIEQGSGREVFVRACPDRHGDVILARKDTPASYHLAACHDDALQGITHIVRGVDLAPSTDIHVLLQALMGWPTPVYTHHALLLDETGKRFAKRNQSMTLRSLRAEGALPEDLLRRVRIR